MNVVVPPHMRIVALAGVLALLTLGLFVVMLSRRSSSEPQRAVPVPQQQANVARPKPAPAPPARPAPARPRVPAAVVAALDAGLPARVARAFANHGVVVIAMYSSEAPADQLAVAEAEVGARSAGAGFVSVDVIADDAATRALATKLDVRVAPAVLVLRQPGTLAVRIDGFSDHETVAQAAVNAAIPE